MASLHNRVSRTELKEKAKKDPTPRITLSFYCYFTIDNPENFRNLWYSNLSKIGVLGRIYIAHEGINAQISCPTAQLEQLKDFIYTHPKMNGLRLNKAVDENRNSFYVFRCSVYVLV